MACVYDTLEIGGVGILDPWKAMEGSSIVTICDPRELHGVFLSAGRAQESPTGTGKTLCQAQRRLFGPVNSGSKRQILARSEME